MPGTTLGVMPLLEISACSTAGTPSAVLDERLLGERRITAILVASVFLLAPCISQAFATFGDPAGVGDVELHLQQSPRWASLDGRSVTLNVASMPGFGAALSSGPSEIAAANQGVADAFLAWSTPALQFNVSLEDPGVVDEGGAPPTAGFDIDVFAVPETHPAIPLFPTGRPFGVAHVAQTFVASRQLTNGQSFAGWVITKADVYLNVDAISPFRTGIPSIDSAALQRLLMHEIGHALGLGHPNDDNPFVIADHFDTDVDPFNAMPIDPLDPFADLLVSPFPDNESVMSNRPCGEPPALPCAALLNPLQPDDLGGRDVLYPDAALASCPLSPEPPTTCSQAGKSILLIKDKHEGGPGASSKDRIVWRWIRGIAAASQSDFADPTADTEYSLCVYDGSTQDLALAVGIPSNASGGFWQTVSSKGYKYLDKASSRQGLLRAILVGGDPGKPKAIVVGKAANLPIAANTLPLDDGADVIVQLRNPTSDQCWESIFPPGSVKRNEVKAGSIGIFKAVTP